MFYVTNECCFLVTGNDNISIYWLYVSKYNGLHINGNTTWSTHASRRKVAPNVIRGFRQNCYIGYLHITLYFLLFDACNVGIFTIFIRTARWQ